MRKKELEEKVKKLEEWIYFHGTIYASPAQKIKLDDAIRAILDYLKIYLELTCLHPEIKVIERGEPK